MATRVELIEKLTSKNPEISFEDMSYLVSETFNYIGSELSKQSRIEIRGFGSFEMHKKKVVSSFAKNSGSIRKVVYYRQSSTWEQ